MNDMTEIVEMIEREGEVIGFVNDEALVRIAPAAACNGCGSRGNCASGAASGQVIHVPRPQSAQLGDCVMVSLPAASLTLAAIIGYLLPPVMLLLGAISASILWGSDAAAVAGAGVGFAVGLILARLFSGGAYGRRLAPTCRSTGNSAQIASEIATNIAPHTSFASNTGEHA